MGNRTYVVFEDGKTRSPAVYLHWNGGPESIYAFLQSLRDYGALNHSPEYSCARFIQLVGNFTGGTLSLGVLDFRDYGQLADEDNGLYVVTPNAVRRMIAVPSEDEDEDGEEPRTWSVDLRWLTPEEVAAEREAALRHEYWHPQPGRSSILEVIRQANDAAFHHPVAA